MNTLEKVAASPKAESQIAQQVNVAFISLLQQHRQGAALSDLSDALKQVNQAVFEQGQPASITLKLCFKPAQRTAGAVLIEDDVTVKLPKPEKENSIFFVEKESWRLMRDNPNQMSLTLKTVDGMATHGEALKEVD